MRSTKNMFERGLSSMFFEILKNDRPYMSDLCPLKLQPLFPNSPFPRVGEYPLRCPICFSFRLKADSLKARVRM